MDTTRAILLRTTKLSDTSFIVSWCTERCGRIKTVAKGARRPKSPFRGKLDLFYESEISFARSRRSELHVLRELILIEPFESLRCDLRKVQLAAYFVELIELTTEPEHAVPEIYDLLRRALVFLDSRAATRQALLHFERELVRLLGISIPRGEAIGALADVYKFIPAARPELIKHLK